MCEIGAQHGSLLLTPCIVIYTVQSYDIRDVGGMKVMPDKESEELQSIRNLLMLLLFKMGATDDEVAIALNVTQGRVSQMMPARGIKPAHVECTTK